MSPDLKTIMADGVDKDFEPASPLSRLQREATAEGVIAPRPPSPKRVRRSNLFGVTRQALFDTPKQILTYADMEDVFPSIEPSKPVVNRWKAHQLRRSKARRSTRLLKELPVTNMGLFGRLPGELRNEIYRLAFVAEQQPALVEGSQIPCHSGACEHTRLSVAAGGMSCASRQLRKELMPVFCAENDSKFDATMVRTRCAANWIRSMSFHARLIKKVVLQINVVIMTPMRLVIGDHLLDVVVECPAMRKDGRFVVTYDSKIPQHVIVQCGFTKMVDRLNEDTDERGRASKLAYIVGSDELADLVFVCKKGVCPG